MAPPSLSRFFLHSSNYRLVSEQEDLSNLVSPDFRSGRVLGSDPSSGSRLRIHLLRFRFHKRARMSSRPRRINARTATASASKRAAVAVDKFLSGPTEESEEEKYRKQCKDLLRKFAASGRVRGYVY